MSSSPILDFDRLLAPVTDESPAGVELKDDDKASARYYAVKDARESARTAERQLQMAWGEEDQVAAIEPPNWRNVIDAAISVLAENSKDLWIAAWLTEGLCRDYGFAGLRDSFQLIRQLCEKYWDDIHPRPDEDEGIAHTLSQLAGLNGEDAEGALIAPIRGIPITGDGPRGPLSNADYLQAQELRQISDPKTLERRLARGAVTYEIFEQTVRQTSGPTFRDILDDVEQALAEFNQLTEMLEQLCGKDDWGYSQAPPSSNIRAALEECRDRIKALAGDKLAMLAASEPIDVTAQTESAEGQLVAANGTGPGLVPMGAGQVQSREDALRVLSLVADYFRRTEPHSILSHVLQQAVHWGRLSFPELMKELIDDETVRSALFRRVGVMDRNGGLEQESPLPAQVANPPPKPAVSKKSEDGW